MACKDCHIVSPLNTPVLSIFVPYGNTPVIEYRGLTPQETPYDFSNKDLLFEVYDGKPSSNDSTLLFSYDTLDIDINSNLLTVTIEDSNMDLLTLQKKYHYRFQMIDSANEITLGLTKGFILKYDA